MTQRGITGMKTYVHNRRFRRSVHRRGVASVLAMMFMVIFGSLAAAMAVVAQSNLRTADSGMKVSRAMSAAETGLAFATKRLEEQGRRFVVEKGEIDEDFGFKLWSGTYNTGSDGNVTVLDYPFVSTSPASPAGIMHAVRDTFLEDAARANDHIIGSASFSTFNTVTGTMVTPKVAMTADGEDGPHFQLTFQFVAGEPAIRVISVGYDRDIDRTLQLDFRIDKKIEFAVLSPNRLMIGKNVIIDGPLGSIYGYDYALDQAVPSELETAHGDPLVLRSDFYHLHVTLDGLLDTFFAAVIDYDMDGDNRLRPNHPIEEDGLTDPGLIDVDGDEYVDDFDLFLSVFDTSPEDGKVVYDTTLAGGTEEFNEDEQLARLIDTFRPDRNGDGVVDAIDNALGYLDGVIDKYDRYAKVHGRLAFAVPQDAWEHPDAHDESYHTVVEGPIRRGLDDPAIEFAVEEDDMREITTDMFNNSQSWFDTATSTGGSEFDGQVQANINSGTGTYEPAGVNGWESVPLGSLNAYDFYERPVYRDMVFDNVRIPMGNNGLFVNCKFKGVTYIETYDGEVDRAHNWNYMDNRHMVDGAYEIQFPSLHTPEEVPILVTTGTEVYNSRLFSNNIRFDGCTFLGSVAGSKPFEYAHWRNKIQFTGQTRFYVDVNDEDLADQTDAAGLIADLNAMSDDDIEEMKKSSILMPGWSVDVGNFDNSGNAVTEIVKLKGTIVAGVMDVRGTADVHGTLLMTFRPDVNDVDGPLHYGGLPDAFNTTIGYFGPKDGDGEGDNAMVTPGDPAFVGFGEIMLRYDPEAKLPDGIPWPIRINAQSSTYFEGGS